MSIFTEQNKLYLKGCMKMKIDCYIINDLLPSYVEDLCSEKTAQAVKEHLAQCPSCQNTERLMRKAPPDILTETPPRTDEAKGAQKAVSRFKHNVAKKVILSLCAVIICAFTLFLSVNQLRGNGFAFSSIPVQLLPQKYEAAMRTKDAQSIYDFQTKYITNANYNKEQISAALKSLKAAGVEVEKMRLLKNELQDGENVGMLEFACTGTQDYFTTLMLHFTIKNGKLSFTPIREFTISELNAPKIGNKVSHASRLNDLYCILGFNRNN